jgi:hypothetical protein
VFLRRYATHCARHRRFAAMNGAARLYADVRAPFGKNRDQVLVAADGAVGSFIAR